MRQWLLGVAGIAILSVLADVILPSGQTKKYIKTIIGFVVTLAVVQPLMSLGQNVLSAFSAENSSNEIVTQSRYLDYVAEAEAELESDEADTLAAKLKLVGFSDVSVTFRSEESKYIAKLNQSYSAENFALAKTAVESANCRYDVEFVWN